MSLLDKMTAIATEALKYDEQLSLAEVVQRIEKVNDHLSVFWSSSHGWAPADAAELMSQSRLDCQLSLSRSLRHWTTADQELEDGDLILGWTNLGSLIEGTIKLFVAVHYNDFKADLVNVKKTQAWYTKQQKVLEPDGLRLEVLVRYVETAKLLREDELALFKLVQKRRNAIHAFKHRDIGTTAELHLAIPPIWAFCGTPLHACPTLKSCMSRERARRTAPPQSLSLSEPRPALSARRVFSRTAALHSVRK